MALVSEKSKATRTIIANNGQEYTLQPLARGDLEGFHTLHSDPRVWKHLPSGRYKNIGQSERRLEEWISQWQTDVSYWSVKASDGSFAGVGGIQAYVDRRCWNIYYRISPEHGGLGLATKVAIEATKLAQEADPELPVIAYMVADNPASTRVAEKIGFTRRWEGLDTGNPDENAIRYIYSDRPLKEDVLAALIAI